MEVLVPALKLLSHRGKARCAVRSFAPSFTGNFLNSVECGLVMSQAFQKSVWGARCQIHGLISSHMLVIRMGMRLTLGLQVT